MNENPQQDEWCFGDYEVLRNASGEPCMLGSGSYGQTYKARNRLLGSELAIKVIRRDLTASDNVRQRFLNEGRSLAHLVHQNIALLRHFGISAAGQIYYAMDYCGGGTLAERVTSSGPRPLGEALEIVRQVASALAAAHAQGIIHRDLKPGNIMLAHAPPPLWVKVIDFGLAQTSLAGVSGGKFHGTAQWASPEQLRELPLDGRSDLFALGLVLWFLLVGGLPDPGSTAEIVHSRLAPGGYANRLPHGLAPDIVDLLDRLLAPDPDRRVGSANELLEILGQLAATHPYQPLVELPAELDDMASDDLPCLAAGASPDERYARLTRLHRDLAGEWLDAELADGGGTRIVFVLDAQWAAVAGLRAMVRANLARLWHHPVAGLPRLDVLLDDGETLVAEWLGGSGGDFASWLKLRRRPALREVLAFLARVARVADETIAQGVPGVGLMAFQVRLEADLTSDGGGLAGAAPRVFPLLLDAGALPPLISATADAGGSTLVLVEPELACDHIHMMARLIYRAVARYEVADAVALAPEAYVPISGLSEAGNQLLCQAISRRQRWDSCCALLHDLAAKESLSLAGSGSAAGSVGARGSSAGNASSALHPSGGELPAKREVENVSQLTAVGGASLPCDTPPPRRSALRQMFHLGQRMPRARWLVLGGMVMAAVVTVAIVRILATKQAGPSSQSAATSAHGPEAALARHQPYVNQLGMRFVEAGTPHVMVGVWETRVGDFKAFVAATSHDAVSNNVFGWPAYTVTGGGVTPEYKQDGGNWLDPHWMQNDQCPVVCISYYDAEEFCKWLTKIDANLPAGWRYRLPSDSEWSAACPDKFQWDNGRPPRAVGNYCGREAMVAALKGYRNDLAQDAGWADDWPRTAPVGSFSPNRYGLYDMGGNVAEWCATFYQATMNTREVLAQFPEFNIDEGGQQLRVVRGASWSDWKIAQLRADFHASEDPRVRNDYNGFRVVLAKW